MTEALLLGSSQTDNFVTFNVEILKALRSETAYVELDYFEFIFEFMQ